ncbi:helix-hairpin-helix domain-containing protein [Paenisporosarcina sp. TG-14]|uniref:helix-hairpin-helix domain-containing protein n=1 Tax=Paenisporosarcina sp. TG-14 TaxID=1231057 RepID=UPI0002DAE5A7|nr:helix-hairpin-helix domain-containing protein [Paenisporosarcina sp. TG-14]
MAILLFQPFSHKPAPPLAGTLETIQNPIPSTIPTEKHPETSPVSIKESESVVVDVKGQVHNPGMYTLPMGSRVLDALQIAGGILPTAEEKELNFAAKLVDEMVIYVPFIGEIDVPTTVVTKPGTTTESQSTIININTADETTLTTLSGIGPSKANAIVTYRDEKGLFQSIDELKKVTGIGDLTFEKLKDFISVE